MSKIIEMIDSRLGMLKVFPASRLKEIEKKNVKLITGELIAGEKTTLDNFFSGEVVFLGFHDEKLQFQIGENIDLFSHDVWCNEFILVDRECLVQIYQVGTARDFRWKKGAWR